MNSRNLSILTLIVMAGALAACGDDTAATTTTELEGTWSQACHLDGSDGNSATLVVTGSAYRLTTKVYIGDSTCASADYVTLTKTGTITLGAAVATPASSKEINYTLATVSITPATANAATGMGSTCGLTWTAGTTNTVTNMNCSGVGDFRITPLYDIYSLVDATHLKVGEYGVDGSDTDRSASTKRPTALITTAFVKQ